MGFDFAARLITVAFMSALPLLAHAAEPAKSSQKADAGSLEANIS